MAHHMIEFSYTTNAWAALVQEPLHARCGQAGAASEDSGLSPSWLMKVPVS